MCVQMRSVCVTLTFWFVLVAAQACLSEPIREIGKGRLSGQGSDLGSAFVRPWQRSLRWGKKTNSVSDHGARPWLSKRASTELPLRKSLVMQVQDGERSEAASSSAWLRPLSLAKLAVVGALLGPAVDAIHNQVLLQYDILPISVIDAKTSLLIPPLLAMAYAILGGALPPVARKIVGLGKIREPLVALEPGPRAAAAVASTAAVIRLSVALSSLPPSVGLPALSLAALIQWIALDGTWASLVLGIAAGIGGPIAEIPLMAGGCWHYLAPDYFPLHRLGVSDAVGGLSALTGPCYFAVTTDSIALGKWFEASASVRTKSDDSR